MNYYNEHAEDVCLRTDEYEHAKDHLSGLVNEIFIDGNIKNLEFHLEEILSVFGIDLPKGTPVLTKKLSQAEISTQRAMQYCVGYSRAYSEILTNSRSVI
jgi:hypothetical protein